MQLNRTSALAVFFFMVHAVNGQTITGIVTNKKGDADANASVLLLRARDSLLVKGVVSDTRGKFNFLKVQVGRYITSVSATGYKTAYSAAFVVTENTATLDFGGIELEQETTALSAVIVTAKKPLLEQKIDRLIINVAASITSAGNTALEILERSPGIIIDHQNNLISMNGKNGVVVMINGRISHMPIDAIVQLLSGMSAGNIEKIELITTPPANFDAEGNAGYINIVLKENENYGTNGSFTVTAGYSKGWITENSITINHRKGKLNLYADISYALVQSPFSVRSVNRYNNQGISNETDLVLDRHSTRNLVNGRAGADIQLGTHTILGILIGGYDNYFTQHEQNQNRKYSNGKLDTVMKLSNTEINHWNQYSGNINLQHNYGADNKLSFNADYFHYSNHQPVNYYSDYYNGMDDFVYNQQDKSKKTTPIHFWVGAIDWNHHFNKNISMEAGLKSTSSRFDNDILFERLQPGGYQKDSSLSATYRLTENYSAVYSSFDITLSKKTSVKIGLRYEYTNSNLGSLAASNIVDRHYGGFFPSVFLSHKLDEKGSVNFSYSRRITRPTFNDLAPFTYYLDPNTLITGNPALQPSFSNTVKVDYVFAKYFLSASYSDEAHAITGFQPSSDSVSGKTILSPENLSNQKSISVALSVPVNVTKWWTMQYNFTGLWQQINAIYQKQPLRLEKINYTINGSMNFVMPKSYSFELSGFYQSKQLLGIIIGNPLGSLDLGLKKKLPGKKGSLVFNVSDLLNTMRFAGTADVPERNLYSALNLRFSQRAFKLSYTRNFGKDKLKQTRERVTGAEEEKGRVQ